MAPFIRKSHILVAAEDYIFSEPGIPGKDIADLADPCSIHMPEILRSELRSAVLIEQIARRGNLNDVACQLILELELRLSSGNSYYRVLPGLQFRV